MKNLIIYTILFFTFVFTAKAQPYFACFNVKGSSVGCNSLTVQLGDCSGSNVKLYDFGVGLGFQTDSNFTYTSPGVYTVRQMVQTGLGFNDVIVKTNLIRVATPVTPQYEIEYCEGNIVKVVLNSTVHDSYNVVMDPVSGFYFNITPPAVVTHTYPDNSSRNITINGNNGCVSATGTTVNPLQSLVKPDISRVEVLNQSASGSIAVTFTALPDQRYFIQRSLNGTGSYSNIDTVRFLSGTITRTYNNLNTLSNRYCFRILAYDNCSAEIYSEEICSIINTVNANNNQNDLTWSAHIPGNVSNYVVSRDGSVLTTVGAGSTSYSDLAINCGVNYCYQIRATLNQLNGSGTNLLSISAPQCATGISTTTPTAIQNLNSNINGSSVQVTWDTPVGFSVSQYNISRSVNSSTFAPYRTSTTNSLTDNGVNIPDNFYCYTVDYTDNCGNNSLPGSNTCPIILNVSVDNSNNFLNHLTWTPYSGQFPGGVQEYQVEILNDAGAVTNSINAGLGLNYDDVVAGNGVQVIRYRIRAIAAGSSAVTYSNIVEIKYEGSVFLPNAFTPNGDGNNDIFYPKGQFVKEYKLTVYNRWGEVVFSSENFNDGWDGNYLGAPATPDAYGYLVEISDLWGKSITKRGSVTLLR